MQQSFCCINSNSTSERDLSSAVYRNRRCTRRESMLRRPRLGRWVRSQGCHIPFTSVCYWGSCLGTVAVPQTHQGAQSNIYISSGCKLYMCFLIFPSLHNLYVPEGRSACILLTIIALTDVLHNTLWKKNSEQSAPFSLLTVLHQLLGGACHRLLASLAGNIIPAANSKQHLHSSGIHQRASSSLKHR